MIVRHTSVACVCVCLMIVEIVISALPGRLRSLRSLEYKTSVFFLTFSFLQTCTGYSDKLCSSSMRRDQKGLRKEW